MISPLKIQIRNLKSFSYHLYHLSLEQLSAILGYPNIKYESRTQLKQCEQFPLKVGWSASPVTTSFKGTTDYGFDISRRDGGRKAGGQRPGLAICLNKGSLTLKTKHSVFPPG